MKFKKILLGLVLGSVVLTGMMAPVYADDWNQICDDTSLGETEREALGCDITSKGAESSIFALIQSVINLLFGIIGAVAVIIIIVAGIQMMTAAGDPNKVSRASTAIMYSVVGLVIALLAYAIVSFVINIFE